MDLFRISDLTLPYELENFAAKILHIESRFLKKNPLGDSPKRQNYVLVPKESKKDYPVVFHLSGYFSTGYQVFHSKTAALNFPQQVDKDTGRGKVPKAIHVFVDAMTYWGGSQFIDSPGCGNYSSYILKELVAGVQKSFACKATGKKWCVMGGSSGGYGALHLVSEKNSPFGFAIAIAPDSYFQASLLQEFFKVAPRLMEFSSLKDIRASIDSGELQEKRYFFDIMNTVAMAHCYSPAEQISKNKLQWPIDLSTGEVHSALWKKWLKHDPIHFLSARKSNLKGKSIFLDVGLYDNFHLQFGTRQIAKVLKKNRVKHELSEFAGNHFGLTKRRRLSLQWLAKKWKAHGN